MRNYVRNLFADIHLNINNLLINIDILIFLLLVPLKILIYSKNLSNNSLSYGALLPPILASVIILLSLAILLPRKRRSRTLFFFNLFISILIISDTNYYRYFKDLLSVLVIKNSFQLGAVKSSVDSLIKISDFLYFGDIFLILFLTPFYSKFLKGRINEQKPLKLAHRFSVFCVLFIIGGFANGKYFYELSKEQPKLLSTMYNKVYIAKNLGIINYHGLDLFNFIATDISKYTYVSQDKQNEIKNFLQTNASTSSNNLKGTAKDKNLIVIQVEALQQFVLNKSINNVEITPNLNRWIKRSAYFDNYFYQVSSGGTSDAEFVTNNSLYPAPSGAAYFIYAGNTYSALPRALADKGYDTAALHGYKETFWNRNIMYKTLGFKNFYGEKSYNVNESIGLGISDKEFFNQSLEKMKKLNNPFFSYLITLSSHYPFDDVNNYGSFPVGEFENTLLGNYFKAIHYTDAQLGMFLDKLEQNGLLDNSVVVIYGDHSAIPKNESTDLAKFLNIKDPDDLGWALLQKVPMAIHFPGDKNSGIISTFAGEVDLYPTLANLFDLPDSNMLGKDLFNTKDGSVIFRNGSFTDGNIFYLSQSNAYFEIKSGIQIHENEDLKAKKENTVTNLEYSDEILKHDLLKKYINAEAN